MENVEITKFLDSQKDLNITQRNIAYALLKSGATKEATVEAIQGYKGRKNYVSSLACPRCLKTMKVVALVGGRKVSYCPVDRICLPLRIP